MTISGKIGIFRNKYQLTNPKYISEDSSLIKQKHNTYSLTEGISEKIYNKIINQIITNLPILNEWHSKNILNKFENIKWNDAIVELHKPENIENHRNNFYQRLAFDEIFSTFLVNSEIRKKIKKIKKKRKSFDKTKQNKIIKELEFSLTNDQKKTLEEINNDLSSTNKMFRLLQGDVGSGKTIVSLLAAYNTVNSGFQVAVMAPTEILARQHFNLANNLFSKKINIELISGKSEHKKKKEILDKIKNNEIDIIFGTHAIFQKKVYFKNLGLIVIDEQHKFGVKQRIELSKKGGPNCDILLMSATPIPRSLILTIYGDMDVSFLDEFPPGRQPITTNVYYEKYQDKAYALMDAEIKLGRQAFVVCPLIEESELMDLKAAATVFESIQSQFPHLNACLIHGKLKKEERQEIMSRFLKNEIQVLVATTVIEVGIDIPNATVMIIEHAERFGLAQLHQLRGRVGRGKHASHCLLAAYFPISEEGKARMKAMQNSRDGFEIAEEDLKIRGPGDFMGTRQSGLPVLKIANLIRDIKVLDVARKEAFALIDRDPNLEDPANQSLKNTVHRLLGNYLPLMEII